MRTTIAFAMLFAVVAGCGGNTTNNNTTTTTTCTPPAQECVNDMVARVCASDGTWVSEPCQAGSVCMAGTCVAKTDVACKPSDSTCMDSTHALLCNSNGVGFMSVTCPANTVCQGLGLCVGTCVVGSSKCTSGTSAVATCTDGFTYTDAACMPGQTSCVITSATGAPMQTAACMPIGCTPGTVCGDKAADPASTDPNYASTCASSPQGLRWQSEQCAVPGSCVPGLGCSPTCTPGAVRCAPGAPSLGIQTCGTTGKWSTSTTCIPNQTGAEQICQISNGTPVCGDPVCASALGACEADGFHPCVNGVVSATAQACTTGVCVASSTTPIAGYTPGSCQAQCSAGDQKCDGLYNYETCSNGRWSATATTCATDHCVQYSDPATGASRTVCGVCVPGSHRCTDNTGIAASSGSDIETCDATGQWMANAACAAGLCQTSGSNAFCAAQCVPNSTVCVGTAPASPPNPLHPGTIAEVTCTAQGTLPAIPLATDCSSATPPASCCATGTSCRKGPNGQPVGTGAAACVQCVGPNITGGNEYGLVDSRCTDSTHEENCTASNTWPSTATTCPVSCQSESPQGTCYTCFGTAPFECSNSAIIAHGTAGGCAAYGLGIAACGATSDCCTLECSYSGSPGPAVCN